MSSSFEEYLRKCRVVKFRSNIGSDEDSCSSIGSWSNIDPDVAPNLRSIQDVLSNPYTANYICYSCMAPFSGPLECAHHFWRAHACHQCPDYAPAADPSLVSNHRLEKHYCSYDDIMSYYGNLEKDVIRTTPEIAEDLRPSIDYFCDPCQVVFESLSKLRVHVFYNHYCLICSHYDPCTDSAKLHRDSLHAPTFTCFRCQTAREFESHGASVLHFLLKHFAEEEVLPMKPSKAPCGTDRHPVLLQHHINNHARVHAAILEDERQLRLELFNEGRRVLGAVPCMYRYRVEFVARRTVQEALHPPDCAAAGLAVRMELVGDSLEAEALEKEYFQDLLLKKEYQRLRALTESLLKYSSRDDIDSSWNSYKKIGKDSSDKTLRNRIMIFQEIVRKLQKIHRETTCDQQPECDQHRPQFGGEGAY